MYYLWGSYFKKYFGYCSKNPFPIKLYFTETKFSGHEAWVDCTFIVRISAVLMVGIKLISYCMPKTGLKTEN